MAALFLLDLLAIFLSNVAQLAGEERDQVGQIGKSSDQNSRPGISRIRNSSSSKTAPVAGSAEAREKRSLAVTPTISKTRLVKLRNIGKNDANHWANVILPVNQAAKNKSPSQTLQQQVDLRFVTGNRLRRRHSLES